MNSEQFRMLSLSSLIEISKDEIQGARVASSSIASEGMWHLLLCSFE
ncbi:MAG: hypothetical protein OXI87_01710 [Albidovulum sp.]|nr:hypothetical protein [Albidovulum sp.]